MKIKVYMKDPDTLYDAITEALEEEMEDLPEDEKEVLLEKRREKIKELASLWFEYGEYLMTEIDTEAKTIRVVPVEEQQEDEALLD